MEHFILHLVVEGIQGIDRLLQKSLGKLVPDVGQLRADPKGYLSRSPVTIGPRKRHALAAVVGLLAGGAVLALLVFAFLQMPKPKRPDPSRGIGAVVSFLAVAIATRAVAMRWLGGGTMTLRPEGAELAHRGVSVFLPWQLFQAPGGPFEPDQKLIVLPIDPRVPVATSDAAGQVRAVLPEDLDLAQVEASDYCQVALKDLYEVHVHELGHLIRDIAVSLWCSHDGVPVDADVIAPLAVAEDGGWVRIHLTQLPFPPVCAGCGCFAADALELPVAGQNRGVKLGVPFCDACQTSRRRRRWVGAGVGAAVGGMAGFVGGFAIAAARGRPAIGAALGVALAVVASIVASLIGFAVAQEMANPISWKDYRPEKGTVKLRFRRPESGQRLLEAAGFPAKGAGQAEDAVAVAGAQPTM